MPHVDGQDIGTLPDVEVTQRDPNGERIHMKIGPWLQNHGRERIHRPRCSVMSLH